MVALKPVVGARRPCWSVPTWSRRCRLVRTRFREKGIKAQVGYR